MRIALQIDPINTLHPETDTSLLLAREAKTRGFSVAWYAPASISVFHDSTVTADIHDMEMQAPAKRADLSGFDVILLRQNPPFDMGYITSTYALELLPSRTRVINHPASVRNHPEKLFPLKFPEFLPPTLISRSEADILAFARAQGEIVIKPLYGYGGKSVFKIGKSQENLSALMEHLFASSIEPVVVQKFIPQVETEEKRIILIDGKVEAAFQRMPGKGEIRSNMRVGGTPIATTLSKQEMRIAEAIGDYCKDQGLLLIGLDVIGGYLNEINITSPTGLMAAKALYNITPEKTFWDAVLA